MVQKVTIGDPFLTGLSKDGNAGNRCAPGGYSFMPQVSNIKADPSWTAILIANQARLEADLEVHKALTQAKIEKIAAEQAADIVWENTSITQAGWKDEYRTLILSIPLILCFVPGMDGYVASGFAALNGNTPEWHQYALGAAIGSSFGYCKLMDFMKIRKGS